MAEEVVKPQEEIVEPPVEGEAPNPEVSAELAEEFDKERALETIRKQRESEKLLARQLKDAQARIKAIDEAEKKKADAEKSELTKAQERAAELEKNLREAQEVAQALRLRQSFASTAAKMGVKFASPQAEDDAFELAELDGVEIDSGGKVTGVEDAVKELQKTRPYLFAQAQSGEGGDGQGTPQRGKNGQGKLNKDVQTGVKVRF